MNGKHEEGAVKGLREDSACPIAKIIICNYLPKATRIALLSQDEGHKKRRKSKTKKSFKFSPLLSFGEVEKLLCNKAILIPFF